MSAAEAASPATSRASRPEAPRERRPPVRTAWLVAAALALAAASLALPSAPGYDPWSWLVWARELVGLDLSTEGGPAWKPLPVLLAAPLTALAGEAAPEAWLVVARAGAILAVLLAFRVARRLGRGSPVAGAAAAGGVVLVPGWVEHAAVGNAEGLLTALLLLALAALLAGRRRAAFAMLAAAALVRVEVWPYLALLGAMLVRGDRRARVPAALAAIGVAALWFVPELLASGELLRSAERARVPNPGAPALDRAPALATVVLAARLPPPVALAAAATAVVLAGPSAQARAHLRGPLVTVGAGLAWIGLVAAMSELGFSGESRYLLPAAALLTVGGIAALFLLPELFAGRRFGYGRPAARAGLAVVVAGALGLTALGRAPALGDELARVRYGAALAEDLQRAVRGSGGPHRLVRCGRPSVGPYRGPLLAWTLGVHKREVEFDPLRPGVAFRSRLRPGGRVAPGRPPGEPPPQLTRTRLWEIAAACSSGALRSR